MTELTVGEFYGVLSRHSLGNDIEDVLLKEHPNARLTVVLGTNPKGDYFIHDAHVFRDTMLNEWRRTKKDERFVAKPYILTSGTVKEIREGVLSEEPFKKRKITINTADRSNIYGHFRVYLNDVKETVIRDQNS